MTAGPTARQVAEQFWAAFNEHDVEGVLALVSDDTVFESTSPAPAGTRSEGRDAVRAALGPVIAQADAHFTIEEWIVAGDTVVTPWRYDFPDGSVRGITVLDIVDGAIVRNLAYVKG